MKYSKYMNSITDYKKLSSNDIEFVDKLQNLDNVYMNQLSCFYKKKPYNIFISSPYIKLTSNINKYFNKPNQTMPNKKPCFYIPIDDNNLDPDVIIFYDKLKEIDNYIKSEEFKVKYKIPLDYKYNSFIKNSDNSKYSDYIITRLDTDLNNNITVNLYNDFTYKNNPNKIYKNKIVVNTVSDIFDLATVNSSVKLIIQPQKVWIAKGPKMYGLTLKTHNIEVNNLKNKKTVDFLLLDENDFVFNEQNFIHVL